jgi:hypothetical protein
MKAFLRELPFYVAATAMVGPMPTLVWAWMTERTVWEVLARL